MTVTRFSFVGMLTMARVLFSQTGYVRASLLSQTSQALPPDVSFAWFSTWETRGSDVLPTRIP